MGQRNVLMDMIRAHPLPRHLRHHNNPAGPRGSLSKVGGFNSNDDDDGTCNIKTRSRNYYQSINIISNTAHSFPDWEKDDQYNGSPPRPAPRGPRTPPGPPPPDDDEEEQVPVAGQFFHFSPRISTYIQ